MKLLNWKYEVTNDIELQNRIQNCLDMVYSFLIKQYPEICIEEKFKEKYDNLIVLKYLYEKGKNIYHVKKNNELFLLETKAAAETGYINQKFKKDILEWEFEPGIIINEYNGEHNIIHELIHYFSRLRNQKIIDGILKDKSGFDFVIYDKDDNEISREYSNSFLTEGITEYLTCKITNEEPSGYFINVVIASILNIGNEELTKIYFSKSPDAIVEYKENFERLTNKSFFDIFNINKNSEKITKEKLQEIIELSINYKINSAKTLEELNDFDTKINSYMNDTHFRIQINQKQIDVNDIIKYTYQCKMQKANQLYNNQINKGDENMDLRIRLKNAIENFKKMQSTSFQNGDINALLTEFEFLTNNLDKIGFDDKMFNYTKDLLSQMQNTLINQTKTNNTNTIINSNFNENEVINYKTRIERALAKYDELFTNNNFSEDLLRSVLREFEILKNELDTITLTDITELDVSTKNDLRQKMDNKISNLKEVYKTYFGDEYKPSGFKM